MRPFGKPFKQLSAPSRRSRPGQERPTDVGCVKQRPNRAGVLVGQYLGRRHHGRLRTGIGGARECLRRHERLAGADVAEQHAVHRLRLVHVGKYLGRRLHLVIRQLERYGFAQEPERRSVHGMGHTGMLPGHRVTPQRHVELQLEDLVVCEPVARRLGVFDSVAGSGPPSARREAERARGAP